MQPVPPQEFFDAQERIAAARVKAAVDAAEAAGVTCHGHTVEALHPWEAILDHAKAQGCDLIVMASHGRRGVTALLLGSETQKVLTHSDAAGAGRALSRRAPTQVPCPRDAWAGRTALSARARASGPAPAAPAPGRRRSTPPGPASRAMTGAAAVAAAGRPRPRR
ncbi:MAG: universal stress protein [Comamonadaceae bacterium]|nr:universal stress protein [Comamonadaceae bacterium]